MLKNGLLKNLEFSLRSKSGDRIPVNLSSSMLLGNRGNKAGIIYIARDISRSKQVDKELKTYREHLEKLVESRTEELNTANIQLQQEIDEHKLTGRRLKDSEEKYSSLFHQSSDAIFVHDQEENIHEANLKALDLFGYKRKELLEKRIPDLHPPDASEKTRRALKKMSKTGFISFEVDYVKSTGKCFPAKVSSTLFDLGDDKLIQSVVHDITEQKRAEKIQSILFNIAKATGSSESLEELLKTIHHQLGNLINTTNFYVALYDNEDDMYSFPYCVDEYEESQTFTPQKMKKSLTDYVRRTGEPLLVDNKAHTRMIKKGEVDLIGEPSPVWVGVPLKIPSGVIGVMVLQSYDDSSAYSKYDLELLSVISDQIAMAIYRRQTQDQIKASLQEKEVLLKEIHHRVKNNMQIISSLLRLQSLDVDDEQMLEILTVSRNRIKSMALIHDTLYRTEDLTRIDFSKYINKLITHLFSIYCTENSRINVHQDVHGVYLNINQAIPCGLITNELVSNSLKHAFDADEKGELHIKMSKSAGKYFLQVQDNGKGLPDELDLKNSGTLGLQIVHDLLKQLRGTISLDRKGGTEYTIQF